MKLLAVFVLCFAAVAFAAPHPRQGCMTPPEWESILVSYDYHTGYVARGRLAHDARGERIRFVEEVEENSTRTAHDDLFLFKTHVHYRVDLKTRKCSKMMLNASFPSAAIQPNSTFLGEVVIGSLSEHESGVLVQNWRHKTTNGEEYTTVTSIGCVPVERQFIGMHGGERIHFHRTYYDVTPGIPNPAVFDVPKECT